MEYKDKKSGTYMQEKVALEKSHNARNIIIFVQMLSDEHQRFSLWSISLKPLSDMQNTRHSLPSNTFLHTPTVNPHLQA